MADLSGRTLGEFVLLEKIGEGGYGDVYRGEQPALRRVVVVKVLNERRRCDADALERFLREAQLASQLDHPYAAHVYAFGVTDAVENEDGLLWIAMEMAPGVTLDAWLQEHGRMRLEQFVPFFERVTEVVHAAYERGIVHRDLKPSNIMVVDRNGQLMPKLLDFGIAKSDARLRCDGLQARQPKLLPAGTRSPLRSSASRPDGCTEPRLLPIRGTGLPRIEADLPERVRVWARGNICHRSSGTMHPMSARRPTYTR